MSVKIKKTHKLRVFVNDLVLVLENPLKGIELLMRKLKEFGVLAGFKINKQRCYQKNEDTFRIDEQNMFSFFYSLS